MPTIDQTVDFLVKNQALEIGGSSWPTTVDGQDVYPIDWDLLFGDPGADVGKDNEFLYGGGWELQPTPEELWELERVLGVAMPERLSRSAGQHPQWDICAWYQPIHFFGHDWGIYIKEDCAIRTALMIAHFVDPQVTRAASSGVWFTALYRAAIYLYYLHEQFHHKIECLGFRLHVVQRKSAFLPYHKLVYAGTKGTDDQLEEALANADAYHRLDTSPYSLWLTPHVVKAVKAYLRWQFRRDPPGYRKAVDYLTEAAFDAGENVLQAQVKEVTLTPAQPVADWDLAPRMTQSFFPITSNIWTVIRSGTRSRLPLKGPVAPIRTCSTQDMIKLYREAGWSKVAGGKGSHVKLKKPGMLRPMILPGNRGELTPGVAKNALSMLGEFRLDDLPRLVAQGLPTSARV